MNKRKDRFVARTGGTPGGSSLMVIFAVLCLTVFAILALSTVLADTRLSDAYAQNVTDYYQADCDAEGIIAQLRAGTVPAGVEQEGDEYSFSCPVGDTRTLRVTVKVEGDSWQLLTKTTEYTADWEADESLDLWGGF